jgi:hypothetical protein
MSFFGFPLPHSEIKVEHNSSLSGHGVRSKGITLLLKNGTQNAGPS